jgi:hypothetical protein
MFTICLATNSLSFNAAVARSFASRSLLTFGYGTTEASVL